eukprot:g9967.t1
MVILQSYGETQPKEAALLGVVCATWARHLGCVGGSAVMAGIVASLVAALPAAVVLAVTFFGWYRADVAVANLTESHSLHPPEQLGRYDLKILENEYEVPMKLNDYEYYRLKVRLKAAGSDVLKLSRDDICKQIRAEATGGSKQQKIVEKDAPAVQPAAAQPAAGKSIPAQPAAAQPAAQKPESVGQDPSGAQQQEPLGKDDALGRKEPVVQDAPVAQQTEPVVQDTPAAQAAQKQDPVGQDSPATQQVPAAKARLSTVWLTKWMSVILPGILRAGPS